MSIGLSIVHLAKLVGKGAEVLDEVIANTLFKKELQTFMSNPSALKEDQLEPLRDWCGRMHKENKTDYPYETISKEITDILIRIESRKSA